ncbi:helix-turn-helix transcriptional regulator [Candidatus Contubernalis alkaliaceticus]|uniref:helix-turn-helix transcriptional regulator n=1 Tax=Candidatus Contubernalis alkaliaceticus TaxID=338645 RepID=UPI001F4C0799|nr:helix-turn-helix domain-containing protein [Candidatus Contubernalis alkalaceticus]UNC93691.1 helix-turn-helix domain-containing protein [Candidatus Contubernalis alkalaceticus]
MSIYRPGKILGTFQVSDQGDYSLEFLRLLQEHNIDLDPSDEGTILWESEGFLVRSCSTRNKKYIIEFFNEQEKEVTVILRKDFPHHQRPLNIVGTAEAAEMLGWSPKKVSVYRQRGKLPRPLYQLKMGPVWNKEDIERWALEQGLIKKVIKFY